MSSEAKKARVKLWLRSEKVFGLESVRGPLAVTNDPPTSKPVPASPSPTASSIIPAPQAPMTLLAAPITSPLLSTEEKIKRLAAMNDKEVRTRQKCRLCETRTNTVFGEGDPDAKIFFIGEGPGENEDLTGRPFVGKAGQLLEKMIIAMGLRRDLVFICNIVKCRPPNNRVPAPDEVATCTPYLERQLEIIRPRAIVTLGLPSARYMLQSNLSMGKLRGVWHDWRGIKLMPTYHPAFLLRAMTYENRQAVWSDLKAVLAELGLPIPERGA